MGCGRMCADERETDEETDHRYRDTEGSVARASSSAERSPTQPAAARARGGDDGGEGERAAAAAGVAARALGVETGADGGEALVAEALALAVGDVIMDMREIAKKSKVVADALFEVDPESMDEAIAIVAVVVAGLTSASGMEDRA